MNRIFVDTSAWLAILSSSDSLHSSATLVYEKLLLDGVKLVTHEGVLLEVGNGFAGSKMRRQAYLLRQKIKRTEFIELVPVSEPLIAAGWELFVQRPDKDWGIVDCISFSLMTDLGISEALTADKHFEQAGFTKLL